MYFWGQSRIHPAYQVYFADELFPYFMRFLDAPLLLYKHMKSYDTANSMMVPIFLFPYLDGQRTSGLRKRGLWSPKSPMNGFEWGLKIPIQMSITSQCSKVAARPCFGLRTAREINVFEAICKRVTTTRNVVEQIKEHSSTCAWNCL